MGGHGHGPSTLPLLVRPRPHHTWEEKPQHEVHPGWWQLFLDLCFVGLAFNVGTAVKHSFYECEPSSHVDAHGSHGVLRGSHDGLHGSNDDLHGSYDGLHGSYDGAHHRMLGSAHHLSECVGVWRGMAFGMLFVWVLFDCWLTETFYHASFDSSSLVGRLLDCTAILFVAIATSCVHDPATLASKDQFWFVFIVSLLAFELIWACRYVNVAYRSPSAHARWLAKYYLSYMFLPQLLAYSAALAAVLLRALGARGFESATELAVPLLLLLGSQAGVIVTGLRSCCALSGLGVDDAPPNVALISHRTDEFSMLMLGEGILQLCVAPWPSVPSLSSVVHSGSDEPALLHLLTFVAAFVVCVGMAHAHVLTEPHEMGSHVIGRAYGSSLAGVWLLLVQLKFYGIMLVGVAVKLAMAAPSALDAPFSEEQRTHIGVSMALAFGAQLGFAPCHEGGWSAFVAARAAVPGALTAYAARAALALAMLLLPLRLALPPYQLFVIEAATALLYMGALHAEVHWLPLLTAAPRPLDPHAKQPLNAEPKAPAGSADLM